MSIHRSWPNLHRNASRRRQNFLSTVRGIAECLEPRLPLTVSALVASPADNGPADLDPTIGAISVTPMSQFVIQLSTDNAESIADATVTPGAVAMTVGGEPLVGGVDYQFAYNAASDQITLTSVNPRFAVNIYDLIVSPNNEIQDSAGASLSATTFHINVTDIVPTPISSLFSLPPQGGLIYTRTIDVPSQTAVIAGTSFEEPPLNATSYAGGGDELGWTRALSNGTPGGNAVFGVKNSAVGLGAPAFPPPGGGTKAYVSRGNGPQVLETLTFDPVDLTGRTDVTFSMNVFRSNTGFENNDRLTITLALFDGTSTTNQVVLNLTGSQLFNLNGGAYTPLGTSIGPQYMRAQLIIQASTNSNQNPPDEVLVYDNIEFRAAAVGGTSYYYVDLDAGQSLTAVLSPTATFRPQLQITGPGLPAATAEASQAGEAVRIADYEVPIAGRYLIAISGLDDTAGYSLLALYTNTTLETEQFVGGSPNDDLATAQDIDAAFINVDGSTSRAGVIGNGEGAGDFYSFTLLPNESASVAVYGIYGYSFSVDLYDSAETHLASGVTANSANQIINHFRSATGGTYYVRVTGTFAPYALVVFRNAIYEQDRSSQIVPLGLNQAGVAMGYADWFSGLSSDLYQLSLVAGQPIRIATTTPGDGPLEFVNALDPNIELYDSSFNPIFSAQGGNADKRNVDVEYVAETSGTYFLRVYGDGTQGEYTVRVTGLEPVLPPFSVTFTSPQDGESLPYMPTEMWVDFNRPISPGSVQTDDLTVNGVAATDVRLYDGDTLIFTLPEITEATANVAIAGGAILDIQELPVDAHSGQFFFDAIAPRIISSSIQEGGVVAPGDFTYVVEFSEPMNTFGLSNSEFSLVSSSNAQFFPQSASFNDSGTILTIAYGALPDDRYTLTLLSGVGALFDRAGHSLDGEPPEASLPPAVSGDGFDGGNFSVHFYADVAVAPLAGLVAGSPLGSMIYGTSSSAGIQAGDTDRFTLELPAGYPLSVAVIPSATLQPHLTIEGPLYHTLAASPTLGSDAIVQLLTIPTDGLYTFKVAGIGGSAGTYRLEVTLNAALESEAHSGPANETLATAQSLDAAMTPLGGSTTRAAVAGDLSPPLGYPGPQYASSVIGFSSQADSFYNGAVQALGAPDAEFYGGDSRAWAPLNANDGMHYLSLGFARPAHSDGIVIREVSGNGFVTQIDLLDVDDVYHTVWTGVDASPEALFDFSQSWPLTEYLVKGAKIYVDTDRNQNMWEEIDAVQLQSPVRPVVDYYAFHAEGGDLLSVSARGPGGSLSLELLDSNDQIVATGSALGTNVDSMVAAYSAPNSGTYYARLSGGLDSRYNLVVLRNATFGLETNNSLATAHNLSETGAALGFVSASSESNLAAGLVTPPVPIGLPVLLTDSAGFLWDILGDGEIGDGTSDAYDGGMAHAGFPFRGEGQIEDAGREVIVGPSPISPVQVTRKIYVPTDQNFARYWEIV